MSAYVRGWLMGFAGGVFLMMVISTIPQFGSGANGLLWVQVIGGTIVVLASVASLFSPKNRRRSDTA